ncbi:MAG TPA: zf-HC2 domain-containing protein [Longimicrobiales bacterium]|nr:zf-HC2 domain-containing protein [Longimicrobiales bacterium]
MMGSHVPPDRLDDYVDGLLEPAAEEAVAGHLAVCGECAAEAGALRALRAEAGALPRSLDPGADLRPGIRAELARRAGAGRRDDRVPGGAGLGGRGLAAAAAVILAAGLLTVVLVRGLSEETAAAGPPIAAAAGEATAGDAEATILFLDGEYARAADEMRSAVDAATATLEPATARLVRTNVAVVERALAESRSALLEDPSSPVLRELVLAAHRQRLEVFRQAAALAAKHEEAT